MIVAGLDEAGYGPRLGPLVVSCTAFSVDRPPTPITPCLWELLGPAVCREPGKGKDARVWVADSKQVKPKKDGVRLLELAVLSFLAAGEGLPGSLPELLGAVGTDPVWAGAAAPWYEGLAAQRLPALCWAGEVHTRAARLRAAGEASGVRFLGAGARVVPEAHFNARVRETDNKAAVLSEACVDLLRALRAAWPGPLDVLIDKHGGRDSYGRLLDAAFPRCPIEPIEEGGELSAYRIKTPSGPVRVIFRQEAELHGLPVALASMLAKYLREMFMAQLNAWFQARLPGLKPTAGYALDANRFLEDVGSALPRLGVDRELLVRAR